MLKISFILFYGLLIAVSFAKAQDCNLCDFSRAETNQCKNAKDLSDKETLEMMKCLLDQKGNKKPYWGVVLRNDVSQTFGPSPTEVIALFYVSSLFYGNEDFADAMVLIYDFNDMKPNSQKAINKAHKSYRKWFEKVQKVGLQKARETKLDPLENTKVSWY